MTVTSARLLRVVAAAGAAAFALSACGASAPAAAPDLQVGSELSGQIPASIAGIAFIDERGQTVSLQQYAGKRVVLQGTTTLCQEHCPIDTATFVQLARLEANDPNTVFLSVTMDPRRDTPAQLAAYRELYAGTGANLPQWHLLTGKPADLTALWRYFHAYVKVVKDHAGASAAHDEPEPRNWRTGEVLTYDVDHSDDVYFIDSSGQQRFVLNGQPKLTGATMPAAMEKFMSAEGHANTKTGVWTSAEAARIIDWLRSE